MYRGPLPIRVASRVVIAAALGLVAAALGMAADVQGISADFALIVAATATLVVILAVLVKRVLERPGRSKTQTPLGQADIGTRSELESDAQDAIERRSGGGEQFAVSVIRVGSTSEHEHPLDEATLDFLAGVLRDLPRASDTVYRLDARVFAVLLTSCNQAGAEAFRDRLRVRFSSAVVPGELGGGLASLSVGVTALGEDSQTFDGLLAAAFEDLSAYQEVVDRQVAAAWGPDQT